MGTVRPLGAPARLAQEASPVGSEADAPADAPDAATEPMVRAMSASNATFERMTVSLL